MAQVTQEKRKTNEQQALLFRSEFNKHKNEESTCKMKYVTFQDLMVYVNIDSAPKALKVIIDNHNYMFIMCFVQIKLPVICQAKQGPPSLLTHNCGLGFSNFVWSKYNSKKRSDWIMITYQIIHY